MSNMYKQQFTCNALGDNAYVQSTGLEWLNTGITLKANDIVQVDCEVPTPPSNVQFMALFGARKSTYHYMCYSMFVRSNSSNTFRYNRTGQEQALSFAEAYGKRMLVECN